MKLSTIPNYLNITYSIWHNKFKYITKHWGIFPLFAHSPCWFWLNFKFCTLIHPNNTNDTKCIKILHRTWKFFPKTIHSRVWEHDPWILLMLLVNCSWLLFEIKMQRWSVRPYLWDLISKYTHNIRFRIVQHHYNCLHISQYFLSHRNASSDLVFYLINHPAP